MKNLNLDDFKEKLAPLISDAKDVLIIQFCQIIESKLDMVMNCNEINSNSRVISYLRSVGREVLSLSDNENLWVEDYEVMFKDNLNGK